MRTVRRLLLLTIITFLGSLLCITTATATPSISVNDHVRLKAFSSQGVPLHPSSGNRSISARLPDGTEATITEIDPSNGWLKITADQQSAWIIQRYVGEVVQPASSPAEPASQVQGASYVVGCWNLEWFHDGKKRGFPENTHGGPSYPPRTEEDYKAIASIIEKIQARILVLEEIYVKRGHSKEVERLIGVLGPDKYDYIVGKTGNSQHVAILYDKRCVRLDASCEGDIPDSEPGLGKLFAREPLLAHFTFLSSGTPMNDLEVVGVHLASGQQKTENHDVAIKLIEQEIARDREEGKCIPKGENDVLIAGDFNASRFDRYLEHFWTDMEGAGWDVLADDGAAYPATRLSGVPLGLHGSKIDYVIVTKGNRGLEGEEISTAQATVHTELVGTDPESFRRRASDHLPVTVNVKVMRDTD